MRFFHILQSQDQIFLSNFNLQSFLKPNNLIMLPIFSNNVTI